jgi:hypothetical protein
LLKLYYNGTIWQQQLSSVKVNLYGVAVRPEQSAPLAVGQGGTTLRFGQVLAIGL